MLKILPKLLLAATAFAPVILTYSIVYFFEEHYRFAFALFGVAAVLLASCLFVIWQSTLSMTPSSVAIKSIKPADKEIVGFIIAYLLPLARGQGFSELHIFIALLVFFMVVMTSNAYHTNPLLSLMGYHFYEVVIEEVGYILISRRNIHNIKAVQQVITLTDYMLYDVTPEKQ